MTQKGKKSGNCLVNSVGIKYGLLEEELGGNVYLQAGQKSAGIVISDRRG